MINEQKLHGLVDSHMGTSACEGRDSIHSGLFSLAQMAIIKAKSGLTL